MLKLYVWRIFVDNTISSPSHPWYAEIAPAHARPQGTRIYNIDFRQVLTSSAFPTQEEAVHGGLELLQFTHAKEE